MSDLNIDLLEICLIYKKKLCAGVEAHSFFLSILSLDLLRKKTRSIVGLFGEGRTLSKICPIRATTWTVFSELLSVRGTTERLMISFVVAI